MTTFQSREVVRDELVTLFAASSIWASVFGYAPSAETRAGLTPFLVIRSRGTAQRFAGQNNNPASYRFSFQSWVYAEYDADDSYTSAIAEDMLDTCDRELRQVVRTNAALTNADNLRFETGFSEVRDLTTIGIPYMVETRFVLADLASGAV